jgi:uncharacterized protein (TIGR03000 family)
MYSVVLAAAMATAPAAPGWGGFGCHGCYGCCGNAFSCHGCCGGCYGSCFGCVGGCFGGCHGSCHGCSGNCYGSGFGCCGVGPIYACTGCMGWGYSPYIGPGNMSTYYSGAFGCCNGCCGGWYGAAYAASGCYGCCGGLSYGSCYGSCYGGSGCWGGEYVAPGTSMPSVVPEMPKLPAPTTGLRAPADAATVVIKAPMDVRITVNGQALARTASEETFVTPKLEVDQPYHYDFAAEGTRDGQPFKRSQKVAVKAGEQTSVDFTAPTAAADGPAHVLVAAPADAKLTVDGVEFPKGTRQFDTPKLEAGRGYYYEITVETVRDGRPVSETRRVPLEANKTASVDFTEAPIRSASR